MWDYYPDPLTTNNSRTTHMLFHAHVSHSPARVPNDALLIFTPTEIFVFLHSMFRDIGGGWGPESATTTATKTVYRTFLLLLKHTAE